MDISLDSLAALSLFVANAVVIIVVIGTYWRMTRYEQSNHLYIVEALRETRDAGLEMKIAARELARVAERSEHGKGGQALPADLKLLHELPELIRNLVDTYGLGASAPEDGEAHAGPTQWPEAFHHLNEESYEHIKRSHRNEVDRMLAQRRRMQMELGRARERLEENAKLLNTFRARTGQSLQNQAELTGAKQQLEQARQQMKQLQDRLIQAEARSARAETKMARLEREVGELEVGAAAKANSLAESAAMAARENAAALEKESAAQRAQLADAQSTIANLREQLAGLAETSSAASEAKTDEERQALQREVNRLSNKVDELQGALQRNLVEKQFIEDHYLLETAEFRAKEQAGGKPPGDLPR